MPHRIHKMDLIRNAIQDSGTDDEEVEGPLNDDDLAEIESILDNCISHLLDTEDPTFDTWEEFVDHITAS